VNYSRRDFLVMAGTTIAAVGVGGGGLAQGSSPTLEADIVVCGSAASGMCAALTAHRAGARVVVLEKASMAGGTTAFTDGMFAVESGLQKKENISLSRDEAYKKLMEFNHWFANGRLVRAFVNKSGSSVDWLMEQGVAFRGVMALYPNGPRVFHMMKDGGMHLVQTLAAKIEEAKIPIRFQAGARKLAKDAKGRITGVIAEDRKGTVVKVNAKAVIIATGDYANNKEMMRKYSSLADTAVFHDSSNRRGEGIEMAWEAGAATEGMGVTLAGPQVLKEKFFTDLWRATTFQPHLWVNRQGERFCAEDTVQIFSFATNAIMSRARGTLYTIFDEKTKRYMVEHGHMEGMGGGMMPSKKLDKLDEEIGQAAQRGSAQVADSLEGLSKKLGVPYRVLRATVEEYNDCCAKGSDYVYGKAPNLLQPVKQAPFYAVRMDLHIMAMLGGIKINHRAEVLTTNLEVIPGLYAAGNCAGGLYGDSYDVSVAAGGALAFAVNSGRIAGENALQYVRKGAV
jgi:fumarate reductase flavoprotein subunit